MLVAAEQAEVGQKGATAEGAFGEDVERPAASTGEEGGDGQVPPGGRVL
jgi:hypothetical protein